MSTSASVHASLVFTSLESTMGSDEGNKGPVSVPLRAMCPRGSHNSLIDKRPDAR